MLAGVFYVLTVFFVFRKRPPLFRWLTAACLLGNPMLLDFFSLARGYGLACAFGLITLILTIWGATSRKNIFLVTLFGALSLLSNYSGAPVIAGAYGGLLFRLWRHHKFDTAMAFCGINLPVVALLAVLTRELSKRGFLYYGGRDTFLDSTVQSMISCGAYFSGTVWIRVYSVITFGALAVVQACLAGWLGGRTLRRVSLSVGGGILIPLAAAITTGTLFIVERTALMLYMALALAFALGAVWLIRRTGPRLRAVLTFAAVCGSGLNLARSMQCSMLNTNYMWPLDLDTRQFVAWIQSELSGEKSTVSVGCPAYLMQGVTYYIHQMGMEDNVSVIAVDSGMPLFDTELEPFSGKMYDVPPLPSECRPGICRQWFTERPCDIFLTYSLYSPMVPASGLPLTTVWSGHHGAAIAVKMIQPYAQR